MLNFSIRFSKIFLFSVLLLIDVFLLFPIIFFKQLLFQIYYDILQILFFYVKRDNFLYIFILDVVLLFFFPFFFYCLLFFIITYYFLKYCFLFFISLIISIANVLSFFNYSGGILSNFFNFIVWLWRLIEYFFINISSFFYFGLSGWLYFILLTLNMWLKPLLLRHYERIFFFIFNLFMVLLVEVIEIIFFIYSVFYQVGMFVFNFLRYTYYNFRYRSAKFYYINHLRYKIYTRYWSLKLEIFYWDIFNYTYLVPFLYNILFSILRFYLLLFGFLSFIKKIVIYLVNVPFALFFHITISIKLSFTFLTWISLLLYINIIYFFYNKVRIFFWGLWKVLYYAIYFPFTFSWINFLESLYYNFCIFKRIFLLVFYNITLIFTFFLPLFLKVTIWFNNYIFFRVSNFIVLSTSLLLLCFNSIIYIVVYGGLHLFYKVKGFKALTYYTFFISYYSFSLKQFLILVYGYTSKGVYFIFKALLYFTSFYLFIFKSLYLSSFIYYTEYFIFLLVFYFNKVIKLRFFIKFLFYMFVIIFQCIIWVLACFLAFFYDFIFIVLLKFLLLLLYYLKSFYFFSFILLYFFIMFSAINYLIICLLSYILGESN